MALLITERQSMLMEIHKAAGDTSDVAKLQKTAEEMFPGAEWKIYCHTTAGRGFMDDEGNLRKDVAYVIGDGPDVVTVFKNGDVIPC